MMTAPPQWSADGLWWWDGTQWRPRAEVLGPVMPPPQPVQPAPGLRILLIVVLIVVALITGLFTFAGTVAIIGGSRTVTDFALWSLFGLEFLTAVVAIVGVFMRARWAQAASIAAAVMISLSCLGLVFGIPILIAALRAPLAKPRLTAPL